MFGIDDFGDALWYHMVPGFPYEAMAAFILDGLVEV